MDQRIVPNGSSPISISLFGAAPDTANLGVSALYLSMLSACKARYPDASIIVFDNGKGVRSATENIGGRTIDVARCGANLSRRYYRSDSLFRMHASAALGGFGNRCVQLLKRSTVALDISGGDSFTDLYGTKRFRMMTLNKRLVLRLGVPLVFMPQTYGPFEDDGARAVAAELLKSAAMAFARDVPNFQTLQSLLGAAFDPQRHHDGVDVAFALPKQKPQERPDWVDAWLGTERKVPTVGLNVSGLIYNRGAAGSRQFGFKADYQATVHAFVKRLLEESDSRIVLVPHVLERLGHGEADTQACRMVAEAFGHPERLRVLENQYTAIEMKWIIAQSDYFCGTRMHSTIAGLSSGVPTAAIAYSKKTKGVFESCGQGDHVADPRDSTLEACVETLWRTFVERERVAQSLRAAMPSVIGRAEAQANLLFDYVDSVIVPQRTAAA